MSSNQLGGGGAFGVGVSGSYPFTTHASEPQAKYGFNPHRQVAVVAGFPGQGGHPGNQGHQGAPIEEPHDDCKNRSVNVKRFPHGVAKCFCSRCLTRNKTLYLTGFGKAGLDWQIISDVRSLFSRYGRLESVQFLRSDGGKHQKPRALFVRFAGAEDAYQAKHALDNVKTKYSNKLKVQFALGSLFAGEDWRNENLPKEQQANIMPLPFPWPQQNQNRDKMPPLPHPQPIQQATQMPPFPWPQPIKNRPFGAGEAAGNHLAHPNIQGMKAPMGRAGFGPTKYKNTRNQSPKHVIGRSPSDPFVSTEPTVLPSPDDPNSWLRPIPSTNSMGSKKNTKKSSHGQQNHNTMPAHGQQTTMFPHGQQNAMHLPSQQITMPLHDQQNKMTSFGQQNQNTMPAHGQQTQQITMFPHGQRNAMHLPSQQNAMHLHSQQITMPLHDQQNKMPSFGQQVMMLPHRQQPTMFPRGQQARIPPPQGGQAMGQQAVASRFFIPYAPGGSAYYPPPINGFVAPFAPTVPAPFPTTQSQYRTTQSQYPAQDQYLTAQGYFPTTQGQYPGFFYFAPAPAPAPAAHDPTDPFASVPVAPVAAAPPAPAKISSPPVESSEDEMPDDAMVDEIVLESGHRYVFCEGKLISKESPSPSFIPHKPTPESPTPIRESARESSRPLVVNGSWGGIHHQLAKATSGRMKVTKFRHAYELIPEGTVPKSVIVEGKKKAVSPPVVSSQVTKFRPLKELIPEGTVPKSVIAEGKKKAVSPPAVSSQATKFRPLKELIPEGTVPKSVIAEGKKKAVYPPVVSRSPSPSVPASVAASELSAPVTTQSPAPLSEGCAPELSPPVAARFPSPPLASETARIPSSSGGVSSSSLGTVIDQFDGTVVRRPSRAQFTRLPSEWTSAPSSGMSDPSAPYPLRSISSSSSISGQLYAPGPAAIHNWHWHANVGPGGFHASPIGPPPAASSVEVHQGFYGVIAPPRPQGPPTRKDKKKNRAAIPNRPPPAASSMEIHHGLFEFPPLSSGLSTGPPSSVGASGSRLPKPRGRGGKNQKKKKNGSAPRSEASASVPDAPPSVSDQPLAPAARKGKKKAKAKRGGGGADAITVDRAVDVGALRPPKQRAGGAQTLRDLFVAPAGASGGGDAASVSGASGVARGGGEAGDGGERVDHGGGHGVAGADTGGIHGCFTGLPHSFDPWPRAGVDGQ